MISFTELYEKRADYIYFLCTRLEQNLESAEALFGEVWKLVQTKMPQLRGKSEEKWLCACLVESHRQYRKKFISEQNFPPPRSSVEYLILFAINQLSLEQRWPFVLKECAGFNYRELSEILKIPEAAVRTRISQARARIQSVQKRETP